MKKSAKDRLFYGVVFLVFVVMSFVIFRPTDTDNYRGTVSLEYGDEIESEKYMNSLNLMLSEIDSNVDCNLGVWPTIKCDFRLSSVVFSDETQVNNDLTSKIESIKFDASFVNEQALNESLSCFDLNNQVITNTEDGLFSGKVNATCILNYQRAEQSIN